MQLNSSSCLCRYAFVLAAIAMATAALTGNRFTISLLLQVSKVPTIVTRRTHLSSVYEVKENR